MVDSFDYVDGTLSLGIRIDESFLQKLGHELRVEVAYQGEPELPPTNALLRTSPESFLTRQLDLGPDKKIVIAKSVIPISQFVWRSRWKLVEIGSVALLLALAISLPLIGRMTNPVELLEIAQAEMKTIFRTNLDGLVFVDEHGLISTCNPAATVALGFEEQDLLGQPLMERLPSEVLAQLDDTAGGTQSATFIRQGHDFRLYRTFIRRQASETLGSILLIHDVTAERERERLFDQFLKQLEKSTEQSASREFVFGMRNLKAWSELKAEKLETEPASLELSMLVESLKEEWSDCDRLILKPPPEGEVLADREHLLLSLHNLIFFSLQRTEGRLSFEVERDGGSFMFSLVGRLPEDTKPLEETEFSQGDPWHSDLGASALGIFVATKLLAEHHSRLSFSHSEGGERIAFHLPKAVKEA